jgi:hypothetical protein
LNGTKVTVDYSGKKTYTNQESRTAQQKTT